MLGALEEDDRPEAVELAALRLVEDLQPLGGQELAVRVVQRIEAHAWSAPVRQLLLVGDLVDVIGLERVEDALEDFFGLHAAVAAGEGAQAGPQHAFRTFGAGHMASTRAPAPKSAAARNGQRDECRTGSFQKVTSRRGLTLRRQDDRSQGFRPRITAARICSRVPVRREGEPCISPEPRRAPTALPLLYPNREGPATVRGEKETLLEQAQGHMTGGIRLSPTWAITPIRPRAQAGSFRARRVKLRARKHVQGARVRNTCKVRASQADSQPSPRPRHIHH